MSIVKRFAFTISALCFLLSLSGVASAQQTTPLTTESPVPIVTATASSHRVRYASLGEVHQTRLQVFSLDGSQVFDSGLRLGNLIDWRLTDQQQLPLTDGSYIFLVTVKEFSDRLTQKYGTAVLEAGQVYLGLTNRDGLVQAQADALEANRQTEVISTVDRVGLAAFNQMTDSDPTGEDFNAGTDTSSAAAPGGENVSGTGTTGKLVKWTNGAAGTLGNSVVTELSNKIGIGTATPNNALHVVGKLELGAASGPGVDPTIVNPNNIANFSLVQFYPAGGTNVNTSFAVVPKGTGVANNRAQFTVFNTDYIANSTNYEFASLRARGSDFVFGTGKSGTGVIRPLMFSAGFLTNNSTNNNQFYLATDGNVGVGTASPLSKLNVQTASENYGLLHSNGEVQVGTWAGIGGAGTQSGWFGTKTIHPLRFFAGFSGAVLTINTDGTAQFAGNVGQDEYSYGLPKAMIRMQGDGTQVKCYNGLTKVDSTSFGVCGFSVTPVGGGVYNIDFGAAVNSSQYSFVSLSGSSSIILTAFPGTHSIQVAVGNATYGYAYYIIVY